MSTKLKNQMRFVHPLQAIISLSRIRFCHWESARWELLGNYMRGYPVDIVPCMLGEFYFRGKKYFMCQDGVDIGR